MTEFNEQESDVSRLIRESPFDDAPRLEHREDLHQRLIREFDRSLATTKPIRSWKQTYHSWRQFMRRPIPRLIAISIVCLTIIAPWLFFPSQQTKAFAFNDLATAIIEAKTAKFKMVVTNEGMPTQESQAYYLAPGRYRMEMSILGVGSVAITDDTKGKILTLMPLTKTAILATSKGIPKDRPSNDPFIRLRDLLSKSRETKNNPFKPIGEKEIDGKLARGFQSDTAMGKNTIWGDPATGQLLLVEAIFSGPKRNEVVMSDFEFNVELDEKLFDLTPPADYKLQAMEVDVSPASEQDFINSFKVCGEISGGELPDSISFQEPMVFFFKHAKGRFETLNKEGKGQDFDEIQKAMKELQPINRGFMFAMELPDSADAYYAGKDVKQRTPDRPIFWYKPKDSTKYRIIYADLSVKECDSAPKIDGAKRLIKSESKPKSAAP